MHIDFNFLLQLNKFNLQPPFLSINCVSLFRLESVELSIAIHISGCRQSYLLIIFHFFNTSVCNNSYHTFNFSLFYSSKCKNAYPISVFHFFTPRGVKTVISISTFHLFYISGCIKSCPNFNFSSFCYTSECKKGYPNFNLSIFYT